MTLSDPSLGEAFCNGNSWSLQHQKHNSPCYSSRNLEARPHPFPSLSPSIVLSSIKCGYGNVIRNFGVYIAHNKAWGVIAVWSEKDHRKLKKNSNFFSSLLVGFRGVMPVRLSGCTKDSFRLNLRQIDICWMISISSLTICII